MAPPSGHKEVFSFDTMLCVYIRCGGYERNTQIAKQVECKIACRLSVIKQTYAQENSYALICGTWKKKMVFILPMWLENMAGGGWRGMAGFIRRRR